MVNVVQNPDILALYERQAPVLENRTALDQIEGNPVAMPAQQIFSYPAKKIHLVDGRYRAVDPPK